VLAFAFLVSVLPAQVNLPPGFFVASVTPAAAIGVPGPLGGIEFSSDGNTLYVGGGANGSGGAIYAVPVTRDPVTHFVTGLGTGVLYASAPQIDGGLQFGPSGTLFFTGYPNNSLGEIVGTTTTTYTLPSPGTTGGMTFVPSGIPNAGALLVSSYSHGSLYEVGLTPLGGGLYGPTTSTLYATLPGGTEGFRFIPSGANQGDIVFTNYSLGNISIMDVDPQTGLPVGGAAAPVFTTFATGLSGAEGFAFDPLTNEFFVSAYGVDTITRIGGFPAPQFPLTISSPTVPLAGGVRQLFIQAGALGAFRDYLILGSASGSSPGITVAFLHLPLNFDDFTGLMYPLVNTSLFMNFQGTTDANGMATATMNIPTIPPVSLGVTITFAGALINPVNATSLAAQLQIVL
jgi:hypothetical protein